MKASGAAATPAKTREWPSFHGEPVPLQRDPFAVGQDFIRALHHRLCQPLTALSCTLEMMQMGREGDAKFTGQLQVAMEQSERVVELMGMFRQLFEAETPTAGAESVLLDAVLSEVVDDLKPLAEIQGVFLIVEGKSSHRVDVPASALRQTLWNVIQNCIELTPRNGAISVEIGGGDVRVSDASQLNAQEMENIFDPFSFCQDPARTIKVSNLPLALAHRQVGAAGGCLKVSRSNSKGRDFHIHLRVADPQRPAGSAA